MQIGLVLVSIVLLIQTYAAEIENPWNLENAISSIFDTNMGIPNTGAQKENSNMENNINLIFNKDMGIPNAGAQKENSNVENNINLIFNKDMGIPNASAQIRNSNVEKAIASIFDTRMGIPNAGAQKENSNVEININLIFNKDMGILNASAQIGKSRVQKASASIFDRNMGIPNASDRKENSNVENNINLIFNKDMGIPNASAQMGNSNVEKASASIFDRNMGIPNAGAQMENSNVENASPSIFDKNMGIPNASAQMGNSNVEKASASIFDRNMGIPNANAQKENSNVENNINSIFNKDMGFPNASAQMENSNVENASPSIFDRNMGIPNGGAQMGNSNVEKASASIFEKHIGIPNAGGHSYQQCGIDKECVKPYLCVNGTMQIEGEEMINIRIGPDDDSPCPGLETCCSVNEKVDKKMDISWPIAMECGVRNPNGVLYKLTGNVRDEAEFGEFPWVVAVLKREEMKVVLQGGGSLITPQVVITVAHNVRGLSTNKLIVRAGEWNSNSKDEIYPHQDQGVDDIIIHERFHGRKLHNDIALLFLEKPFDMAPNVNVVCLPPVEYNFDYSRCFVSGWGKDKFSKGRYVNIMKKIEVPALPHNECQEKFRNTRLSKYFLFHSSFMCAGGEAGMDACTGDGGAPLVCPIPGQVNRFYQAGIVAWGLGCGEWNIPGAYASIVNLRSWIDEKLSYKNINPSFYTA